MNAATVIDLGADAEQLIVDIEAASPLATSPELEAQWQALCALNPRLFNGRILVFIHADLAHTRLRVRVDEYKHRATQNSTGVRLTQFGVTGVLIAPGAGGHPSVLLGRRSAQTHIYPGQWELAPSGGVDAPPPGTSTLVIADIRRQLERELVEETGVDVVGLTPVPVALCHDPNGPSMDVIFRIDLDQQPSEHATWEYDDLVWVGLESLAQDLVEQKIELIPPSGAVLRWMRWL